MLQRARRVEGQFAAVNPRFGQHIQYALTFVGDDFGRITAQIAHFCRFFNVDRIIGQRMA